jgi:hypothetical protein
MIGMIEIFKGNDTLTIGYLAAFNQNMLMPIWIKERMSLLPDICVKTVMILTHQMRTRLFHHL